MEVLTTVKVTLCVCLFGISLGLGGVLASLLGKNEKIFIFFGTMLILSEVAFGLTFISIM